MQDVNQRLLLLHRCTKITRKMLTKLLTSDPTLQSIFNYSPSEISQFLTISIKKAVTIHREIHSEQLHQTLVNDKNKLFSITILDERYPAVLKQIPDPPLVIYGVGQIGLLKYIPSLSVVGTRQPTQEARAKLEDIVGPLVREKWMIVSGLAKGIDGYAHEIALKYGAPTLAVLGGGFSHIYPKKHYGLFKEIMMKGLVISEYPHDIAPQKYHFPERNRIISGLTHATLVIEAKIKSGSLITVDQALEQGKDVYALPGSPLSKESAGCNLLIQEGAKLIQTSQNIMEDYQEKT